MFTCECTCIRHAHAGVAERDTRAEPHNIHTVFSTECSPYFDWQSVGLVHSHRKVGMPGRITRLMACDEAKLANYKVVVAERAGRGAHPVVLLRP